jgi:hypothetical protein
MKAPADNLGGDGEPRGMGGPRHLDTAARHPQTAPAPPVILTVKDDRGGQGMADVVRIVLEEMRDTHQGGGEQTT